MQEPRDYTVLISTFVTELRKPSIDDDKGVYFVFSGRHKEGVKYELLRLLYIGRSSDVNKRVNGQHHKHAAILSECNREDSIPIYCYAEVCPSSYDDIMRVESALIYNKQPILNYTADKEFHHPDTHIRIKFGTENQNMPIPKTFGDADFIVLRTAR